MYGGTGGAGGAVGSEGKAGTLYVSPTAIVNVSRAKLSATTHPAAEYTIVFDANVGQLSSEVESLTATLGCALPDAIPAPTLTGYRFCGWSDDNGIQYYDPDGTKTLSSYPVPDDTVLHAVWELDPDKAVLPDNPFWLRENADVGWFVDPEAGEGETVLRSGAIGSNTNSWMETTIVGPASFSFDWKVSCNSRGHYLLWAIDGAEQSRIRGVTDWATVSNSIPEGEHVIRFDYVKGSTGAAGEDKGQVRNFVIDPVRIDTGSMQVLWDWTTNYCVSVATSGFGTADFDTGWIADGSNLVVNLTPSIHSYRILLSGDTNGVVLSGTQLDIPVCGAARAIDVSIEEVRPKLVIASSQGASDPVVGEHEYPSDAEVTVSAVAPDSSGGVRAVCTGWIGAGSVPVSGDGDSVTFTIMEESSLTWEWTTGYWIDFSIVGKGTTSFTNQWVAEGTELTIPFTVNTPFHSLALSGDVNGAVLGDGVVTFTANGPRSIVLTVTEYTYKEALDESRLDWTSGGSAVWEAQATISHDGEDAVKSGGVTGDDVSTLSTTVSGPGTLSWWWKLEMTDCSGVEVFVDNASVANLDMAGDWTSESVSISGEGSHVVRFEFWNAGTGAALSDCAYLDMVSWTPEGGVQDHTVTTPEPVPYAWLSDTAESILAAHGGDYEAAGNAMAANGVNKVWECYVAGISPTNAAARFEATIEMGADGKPVVTWTPPLAPEEEAKRMRKVLGKRTLVPTEDWADVTDESDLDAAGWRFFKVKVEMK